MARIIIKLKVMPTSPDVNLDSIKKQVLKKIDSYGGILKGTEIEPIAFGLKAIIITFNMDESRGSTDLLEEQITEIEDVQSVEIIGISRALG
ncbi:elongation factor 1-beta [Candidatus Woesearchaeota archaeon]|nr:elongation factor 1-beta [Candidatus Woesearchaeota archaeon]